MHHSTVEPAMARPLAAGTWLALSLHARDALAFVTATTTEYVVDAGTSRSVYSWDYTDIITPTRTVKPYVTPTAAPIATTTYTRYYDDVKVVELRLPEGSVDEADFIPAHDDDYDYGLPGLGRTTTNTVWIAPVTLSAPASCPTPFTVHTTATVRVDAAETATLRPTATKTYTGLWGPAVTMFLSAAPPGPPVTYGWDYEQYVAECERPPSYSSSSGGGLKYDDEICVRRSLCLTWGQWIIVLATVPPGLFVLGFAESFFWFRRLMRGRRALRLGTTCWVLISAWMLCATRQSPPRAEADWPALEAQWAAMPAAEKWRLWWKWGFRHKYPIDLLGPEPGSTAAGALEAKVEEGAGVVPQENGPAAPQQPQQQQLGQGHSLERQQG